MLGFTFALKLSIFCIGLGAQGIGDNGTDALRSDNSRWQRELSRGACCDTGGQAVFGKRPARRVLAAPEIDLRGLLYLPQRLT